MLRPLSAEAMNSLTDALLQGRKIEAIKLYRELTGLGLKEAKDTIEELEQSLYAKVPDKFAAPPKRAGCLGGTTVLCGGLIAVAWWLVSR